MSFRVKEEYRYQAWQANGAAKSGQNDSIQQKQFERIIGGIRENAYYGIYSYTYHLSISETHIHPEVLQKLADYGYKIEVYEKDNWKNWKEKNTEPEAYCFMWGDGEYKKP